jgi:hypothetical protein
MTTNANLPAMKKMSEVFELPLSQLPEADDQIQDANGDWTLIVRLPWRTDYAIKAINHVDAMADALESCADLLSRINFESADEYQAAKAALAAYRGDV